MIDNTYITEEKLQVIRSLRQTLHATPELSMQEHKTAEIIRQFLKTHTSCEIIDHGTWFYALRRAKDHLPTIAFRADIDAIPDAKTGIPFHGCGHDGHAAAVAGLAYLTEGMPVNKNLVFLFQPGEETGEGAAICSTVIEEQHVDIIYGCHSIPGFPRGTVLWRGDVFACASRGMILHVTGTQCHAAYPETGKNPAFAVSHIVSSLCDCLDMQKNGYRGMVLATVVGINVGAKAFGVSAGDGELYLTVRAHYDTDLEALIGRIRQEAELACERDGVALDISFLDVFPDTVNDAEAADAFRSVLCEKQIPWMPLAEPMRWSEDFGWYCKKTKGVFFGIGAGEDCPALHTASFCYQDALLPRVEEVFLSLC